MPTQKQYDVTLQRVRQIDCKIAVLDKDYTLLDEISGSTISISLSVNADSDIRRTADININLKDDISQNQNQDFYWIAGNPYWFDKYVQIYTAIKDVFTDEDIWVNQGIYCVNAPSISYDAVTNSLSFQAVDLAAKMTGMRNGQLQGSTTTIPVNSNIKNAIETVLLEQGFTNYILYDPPQKTTPEDINIDAGGTAWDLLTQLRDINANWEMFFDEDGVFHFQEIPNGKIIINETSTGDDVIYTYSDSVPLVDEKIWDKVLISASYETNFENVKNYIEVYGKTHDPTEFVTGNIFEGVADIILEHSKDYYLNSTHTIEFGLGSVDEEPAVLGVPISLIYIYDKDNTSSVWTVIDIRKNPITITNEFYCLHLIVGDTIGNVQANYLGYMQARAWAIDNNPESPFYVGKFTEYKCKAGTNVDFIDEREIVEAELNAVVSSGIASIDIRPWLSASEYNSASVGYEWKFKVHMNIPKTYPVTNVFIRYGNNQNINQYAKGLSGQQISLDFTQDYLLVLQRTNLTPDWGIGYYPTEASNIDSYGTDIVAMPKFTNQVRCVCSGGEYDNIFSNELAEQRAKYEIYLRSRLHDSIDIKCVPIYWLDVNQIIEYKLPNNKNEGSDYWLIKSISTDISVDGTQTINAMRYYSEYA